MYTSGGKKPTVGQERMYGSPILGKMSGCNGCSVG